MSWLGGVNAIAHEVGSRKDKRVCSQAVLAELGMAASGPSPQVNADEVV